MSEKKGFKVVQPLSMRLLIIVSLAALTINTLCMVWMFARETRTVNITVVASGVER